MGRHDLRPLRVHRAVAQLLQTPRLRQEPPWFDIVQKVPPAQALVRVQPVQHRAPPARRKIRKASKLFQPQPIVYPEDQLRREFYTDHPWELARPRMILETDGKDARRQAGSQLRHPEKGITGESVVQRQLWLMENEPGMSKAEAYDRARHEFYVYRHEEDVERRVAQEEATFTGATFGPSRLAIGMELENQVFEGWKAWAIQQSSEQRLTMNAFYSGDATAAASPAGAAGAANPLPDTTLD
ncbi:MAG: mitochondrial ribosomal small subunit component [Phylliscum demangeonii]|nr:MAG: mitochondrial ribosomal small subunit component [Phylliscum demangeonii]